MSENAARAIRYQHWRQVMLRLNTRLVKDLPKHILHKGGKELGLLKGKVFTMSSEDQFPILLEHCFYDVLSKGANVIDQRLAESPPPPGSDERILMEAMQAARYSAYAIEAAEPEVGVQLHDLLREDSLFLFDVGFSRSMAPGTVVAGRIIAPEGVCMTTGAALPIGVVPAAERTAFAQRLRALLPNADFRHLTRAQESHLATNLIRQCLKAGASDHVRYADPNGEK